MSYDQTSIGIGGAIWAAGISMSITSYICLLTIISQIKNWKYPAAQRPVILICLIPILIGWESWAVLVLGEILGALEFVTDIAKAIGVICFNRYVVRILGWDEEDSKFIFNRSKAERELCLLGEIKFPCKCCKPLSIESEEQAKGYINRVSISGIQFFIVVVFVFILSIVVYAVTDQENLQYAYMDIDSAYLWTSALKTISMVFAIYNMILFSGAAARFEDSTGFKLRHKFRTVQIAFLLTQPQALVIGFLADFGWIADEDDGGSESIALFTLNLVLCTEMVVLAFVMSVVFSANDYNSPPKHTELRENLLDNAK